MMKECSICRKAMNEKSPIDRDCGGGCGLCMALAGDGDCQTAIIRWQFDPEPVQFKTTDGRTSIDQEIHERLELIYTYAEDGAMYTAAARARELSRDLLAHARFCDPRLGGLN